MMKHPKRLISKSRYLFLSTALIMLFSISASAYTIVMLDGRRIQIPAQFTVGTSTLTYVAGPEIQITLQLAAIDIAATERANGESSGSFLHRRNSTPQQQNSLSPTKMPSAPKATRSITNRDLERHARVRTESERAYETRRIELGLPSIEESRMRREAESELVWQELEDARMERAEAEGYWRQRASELRSDISAVDAELAVVRTRLDEIPTSTPLSIVSNAFPLGYGGGFGYSALPQAGFGFGQGVLQPRAGFGLRPRVYSPRGNTRATSGLRLGGTRGRRGFPGNIGLGGRRGIVVPPQLFPLPYLTTFGSAYNNDLSYEREALVLRLNELVGRRAALRARWGDLEEEARRAGAMPGWLRP